MRKVDLELRYVTRTRTRALMLEIGVFKFCMVLLTRTLIIFPEFIYQAILCICYQIRLRDIKARFHHGKLSVDKL